MILSTKQKRLFTLAVLLSSGESVSANAITSKADCSGATLTRGLRELREAYNASIKYSKSNHTYQMTDAGTLTHIEVAQMKRSLKKYEAMAEDETISLTKVRKRPVTLSLTNTAIAKLEGIAVAKKITRSEVVEMLIDFYKQRQDDN